MLMTLLVCTVGCSYERKPNCHLDKLNVKGNVVKIETITNSTIPLTEMTYDIFGNNGINTMNGNVVVDFDNNGFIERYTGYGIDGKQIFSNRYFNKSDDYFPATIGGYENIVRMETVKNDNGQVTEAIYYGQDQKPVFTMKMYYDEDGNATKITKEKSAFSKDSTEYKYLQFDQNGNWTEVEVSYNDFIESHHHKYTVKRQITYDGESSKTPLINLLNSYTASSTKYPYQLQTVKGSFFEMSVPDFMTIKDLSSNRRTYNSKDGGSEMAYLAISLLPGNHIFAGATSSDFVYDAEADKMLHQRYSNQDELVRIFKWIPFEFVKINGYYAMHIKYYRYGNLTPLPQFVEQYVFDSPQGEVDVTLSYRSDKQNQYSDAFKETISTLRLF